MGGGDGGAPSGRGRAGGRGAGGGGGGGGGGGVGAGLGCAAGAGRGGAGAHDGDHGLVGEVVAAEPESLQPRGAARLSQPRGKLGGRGVVKEIVAQVELLELRGIVRSNARPVWWWWADRK